MWNWNWLDIPNVTAVLRDSSVGRELSRVGYTFNGHLSPLSIVSIGCISTLLGINVGVEIEASDVVVTSVSQSIKLWVNNASVTEESTFDGIPDSL